MPEDVDDELFPTRVKARGQAKQSRRLLTKADSERTFNLFLDVYCSKYPKATSCMCMDWDDLLAFNDFPLDGSKWLAEAGVEPSVGSVDNSYDNAVAETFLHTLKVEMVHGESFATRKDMRRAAVFQVY